MKLTELWTPAECREAIGLMGGVSLPSVHGTAELEYIELPDSAYLDHYWLMNEGIQHPSRWTTDAEAACIIQVAAEQVVREAGIWITSEFMVQRSGGEARDAASRAGLPIEVGPYPTYLAALLAALRAVGKETRDGE